MNQSAGLRERLMAMRERLESVDPDSLLDREYAMLENDRDTLAEAVDELARLEARAERDRLREVLERMLPLIGAITTQTRYDDAHARRIGGELDGIARAALLAAEQPPRAQGSESPVEATLAAINEGRLERRVPPRFVPPACPPRTGECPNCGEGPVLGHNAVVPCEQPPRCTCEPNDRNAFRVPARVWRGLGLPEGAEPIPGHWRMVEVGDSVVIDNWPAVKEAKQRDEPYPNLRYAICAKDELHG